MEACVVDVLVFEDDVCVTELVVVLTLEDDDFVIELDVVLMTVDDVLVDELKEVVNFVTEVAIIPSNAFARTIVPFSLAAVAMVVAIAVES